jgi:Tol biopolymer transport system component
MHGRSLASLVVLVALCAATSAGATAPGRNGQLVFRAYLDAARTTGALFVANPSGSSPRRVTRPPRGVIDQEADWSPDGRKIAFERKVPCPAGGSRNGLDNFCDRIYTVKRNGRGLKALVPCGFKASGSLTDSCVGVQAPAWSPDGSRIAFRYSLVDDDYTGSFKLNSGIWIVNANGTGLHQITQRTSGNSWDFTPQWSPDGTKLVFVRVDLSRQADAVFTVNIDGTGLFQVTPWELNGGNGPDWSPDGRWILFTSEPKDGSANLYAIHPDGTGTTNLTKQGPSGYHYLSSSFSPDGAKIATARTPGAGPERAADLVVMNADGSNPRAVTKTRRWESAADWGPRT